MLKNLKNKKKKGFTLIELIIVIAIIAILAAVAIPKFGEVRKNANVKADVANAKTIANAVTALIAEDKIENIPNTSGFSIEATTATVGSTDAERVALYLQNVPTPKSDKNAKNFKVTIDGNGGVKVFVGDEEFFPASATATE